MLERVIVGDTLNFTTSVANYTAADGWTLHYRLVPRGTGTAYEFACAADSADPALHRAQVSVATTAAWTPGTYSWHSWVTKAAESYTFATGSVQLLANPRTSTSALDLRSEAQTALEAARAALAAWTPTTRRYSIAGREMEFNSPADIVAVISYWEAEVAREENTARINKGQAGNRQVFVRLGRA